MSETTQGSGPVGDRPAGTGTAFVLGGGGNLGSVQVGMLRALFERGVTPEVILGCSAGALNAAVLAQDPSLEGVRHLERIWAGLRGDDIFPNMRFSRPWSLFRRVPSLCANGGLRSLVERELALTRFEDAAVPFEVVATDLETGHARWFARGDVVEPILASAALPAILPPVVIEGRHYIDGGVVENVPVGRARQLRCERIVVLHVGNFSRPRPRPQRPIDILLHAFSIARNYDFERERSHPGDDAEVIFLPAVDPGALKRNDFSRSAQLIDEAHETAGRFLDEHRAAPTSA